MKHIYEIAKIKMKDVPGIDEEKVSRLKPARSEGERESRDGTDIGVALPLDLCRCVK